MGDRLQIIDELRDRVHSGRGADPVLDRDILAYEAEYVLGWKVQRIPRDAKGENESEVLLPPHLPSGFEYPPLGKISRSYHVSSARITGSVDEAILFAKRIGVSRSININEPDLPRKIVAAALLLHSLFARDLEPTTLSLASASAGCGR